MTTPLQPSFSRLPAVSWVSPWLFEHFISCMALTSRFGLPSLIDLDSNGVGLMDAWLMGFDCGLEVSFLLMQIDWETGEHLLDDTRERRGYILSNQRDARHIVFHLGLEPAPDLSRWLDPEGVLGPLDWRICRQDDNGHRFEVGRYSSRCEAEFLQQAFEQLPHKQYYWVEGPSEVDRGKLRGV